MPNKYVPPPSGAKAWTIEEFCFLGRFKRDKFYALAKSGDINFIKLGKRTLIPANDGRAFFEARGLDMAS